MTLPDHVKRAIRSGPVPEIRDWRSLPTKGLTRAERNMRFCESMLVVPEGALVGKPIRLDVFQESFFYSVYDNEHVTTDAYLSIARKNSKTATIAMIALIHLVGPEATLNSEIMSGARSRDQAGQVFRYAEKMAMMSPKLREIVRSIPSKKRLVGLPMNTEYTASAAEAATTHGGSPVVAILDELGQVKGPHDDFVDAVITSQGAHENPLLLAISTQSPTDADLFSVWLDDAAKGEDPHIVSHVYEADADCDLEDRKQWKYANPAMGVFRSEKDIEKMAGKAARMPSSEATFRNLFLNQRVNTTSPLISRSIWELNCASPEHLDGMVYYGGLDLSARTDLTSFVLIGVKGKHVSVWPYFWTPSHGLRERAHNDRQPYELWAKDGYLRTTPGKTVDYEFVASEIAQELSDAGIELEALAFDRWRIDLFIKDAERAGVEFPMVKFGQGYKDMGPAVDALESVFLNGDAAHGMHPVLTMCAANTVTVQDPAGNRKLDKSKSTGRIDGMVALSMAIGSVNMESDLEGPSVYEQRGVLTL